MKTMGYLEVGHVHEGHRPKIVLPEQILFHCQQGQVRALGLAENDRFPFFRVARAADVN